MFALTACGDDSDESSEVPSGGETSDIDDPGNDSEALGESSGGHTFGTIEADGVTYDIGSVLRCDPEAFDNHPVLEAHSGVLSMQAVVVVEGRSHVLFIDVIDAAAGAETNSLTWRVPDGMFTVSSNDLGSNVSISWTEGDEWATGSGALVDVEGSDSTVDVTFRVQVPPTTRATC